MLTATDSFLEYLAANLPDITVYWWRQSAQDEHDGLLKMDALNVKFLGFFEDGQIERCPVSLDLLGSDERTVLTQLKTIRDLLFDVQLTPELDYTIPAVPQPTGRAVSWTASRIHFIPMRAPKGARYVHYNATFPLTYTRL